MRQGLQLLLLLPVVVGVLLGGAAVLRMLEGETETLHNWVDSTYFCFTTLTTIGYGNFAPTVRPQPSCPCWRDIMLLLPRPTHMVS